MQLTSLQNLSTLSNWQQGLITSLNCISFLCTPFLFSL